MSELNYEGEIIGLFGPMFSEKTTGLLRLIRRGERADMTSVVIKYAGDTRYYNDEICTHDNITRPAFPSSRLYDTYNAHKDEFEKADQIGIDEGQFFPDLIEFSEEMANKGKRVIIAMLDGNFEREEFGVNKIEKLLAICDSYKKLKAICQYCKKGKAGFSKRIVSSKEKQLIGGSDKYHAACRKCYHTVVSN